VLVFIEHGSPRMCLGGVAHPTGNWTAHQARNIAVTVGAQFEDIRFLIRDRGSNFTSLLEAGDDLPAQDRAHILRRVSWVGPSAASSDAGSGSVVPWLISMAASPPTTT
jgi:hypothetical protein